MKPVKMYMVFSPIGERQYGSLRLTARKAKWDWAGNDWLWKYHKQGWRVHAVRVDVRLMPVKLNK